MKKLTALSTATSYLLTTATTHAQELININLRQAQTQGVTADVGQIPTIVQTIITFVFSAASLLVLFYMILGAFNWITSGGDKEKVGAARKLIVNALIGFAILAVAFLIVNTVGQILGYKNIFELGIPKLPAAKP